jgi:hypothetical protein
MSVEACFTAAGLSVVKEDVVTQGATRHMASAPRFHLIIIPL